MTISESARVNTAAEYLFRVDAPNSIGRTASLIALDPESMGPVRAAVAAAPERRGLVELALSDVTNLPALLRSLPGQTRAIIDEATRSDMVVMVAKAGYRGDGASLLGEACRLRNIAVTAVVVAPSEASDVDVTMTLARLRPFATMLVVVGQVDYLGDMLDALRA